MFLYNTTSPFDLYRSKISIIKNCKINIFRNFLILHWVQLRDFKLSLLRGVLLSSQ